eukprot:scaffold2531_cov126-Skeletonema_dohrnii-CCMP3373.AAC.2
MAEAHEADDEIFVYTGGDQEVPYYVWRVRIDQSVTIIPRDAFYGREHLIYVEFHDDIEKIGEDAFNCCYSLSGPIRLLGVKIIGKHAFYNCGVTDVEFGDKLETIEGWAFNNCRSLRSLTMPSVRSIDRGAFIDCYHLTDLDLPEGLETIGISAFSYCKRLGRIAIPLNCMIGVDVLAFCPKLTTVDLVGGIHLTIASLHLESWRNQMMDEMNRINQVLPTIGGGKTAAVQQWMESVLRRINYFKAEHKALLKEAATLLELALWKANLDDNEGCVIERQGVRMTRGRRKRARKEICVTSGANIVIKNTQPLHWHWKANAYIYAFPSTLNLNLMREGGAQLQRWMTQIWPRGQRIAPTPGLLLIRGHANLEMSFAACACTTTKMELMR